MISLLIGLMVAIGLGLGLGSISDSILLSNGVTTNSLSFYALTAAMTALVFGTGLHKVKIGWKGLITLLGKRTKMTLSEGWVWVFPLIMGIAQKDTRETTINPEKTRVHVKNSNSEDASVPVSIDFSAQFKITGIYLSFDVDDIPNALALVLERSAREICSKHTIVELTTIKDELSKEMQESTQRIAEPWGVEVMLVRIQDIEIPKAIENAATKITVERYEAQSELIEFEHVVALVEVAKKTGISAQEAFIQVQVERGKAQRLTIDSGGKIVPFIDGQGGT